MKSESEGSSSKISRWGNSMGVRLPRTVLARVKWTEGMAVKVEGTSKGILLTPAKKPARKRKYTLRELCKGMTPEKSHPEFDWGGPAGSEI